jgi:hypothetical protein
MFLVPAAIVACTVRYPDSIISRTFLLSGERLDTWFASLSDSFGVAGPILPYFIVLLVIMTATCIHESGHWVAGKFAGFKFKAMTLGALQIVPIAGHIWFRLQARNIGRAETLMEINSMEQVRVKLALYVLAGPFANLTSCFAIAGLLWLAPIGLSPGLLLPLQGLAWYSASVFVLNLVPFRTWYGNFNDGARLWMLFTGSRNAQRWVNNIALGIKSRGGARAKEWDAASLEFSASIADNTQDDLLSCWFAYCGANDRDDAEKAAAYLERSLAACGIAAESFRQTLVLEAAVFHAWFRNDAEKAQRWLQRSSKAGDPWSLPRLRVSIALNWADGNFVEAMKGWEEAMIRIRAMPPGPVRDMHCNSWQEWKQQMTQKRESGSPLKRP